AVENVGTHWRCCRAVVSSF
ncbi:hypothetical protein AVDCRST_MAG84-6034, partial [uncultured Microcoleus sp.]